ncbi:MAG: hypothetical protein M5U08_18215 [Burkholderiales bacterium]|nr:hypothetical protein [Burkholderiales bacterium]
MQKPGAQPGRHQLAPNGPRGKAAAVSRRGVEGHRQPGGGEDHIGLQRIGEILGARALLGEQQVEGDGARAVPREVACRVGEDIVCVRPWSDLAREPRDRAHVGIEHDHRIEVDAAGERSLMDVVDPPVEPLVERCLREYDGEQQRERAHRNGPHPRIAGQPIGQHRTLDTRRSF